MRFLLESQRFQLSNSTLCSISPNIKPGSFFRMRKPKCCHCSSGSTWLVSRIRPQSFLSFFMLCCWFPTRRTSVSREDSSIHDWCPFTCCSFTDLYSRNGKMNLFGGTLNSAVLRGFQFQRSCSGSRTSSSMSCKYLAARGGTSGLTE